jgi:YbbR domain-containing protein
VDGLANLGRGVLVVLRESVDVARHNLMLGVLSIGLAVAIWFVVVDSQNTPRTDFFPALINVEVANVPQGEAVSHLSQPSVKFRITADEDVWNSLSANNFKASVDLSTAPQGAITLPVTVSADRGDIKVVEVQPAQIVVDVEPLTTATVPVQVKLIGTAPLGYSLSDSKVSPQNVTVSGPESLVKLVAAAVADVNLTGVQVSLEHDSTLTARDSTGSDVNGVQLNPDSAKVGLTIERQELDVAYVVNPSLSGNVAPGYRITAIETDPTFVSVKAPVDVLQSISVLSTEPISVDGAQSDVVRSVKIRLPSQDAHVNGSDEVVVRVRVAAAPGEAVFSVAGQASGLKEGLVASLSPPVVSVTVAGPLPTLQTLPVESIGVTVDLSNLGPGVYNLAPAMQLPADVTAVRSDPAEIQVTITSQ